MDLVAREFGLRKFAGDQHRPAAPVHLFGVPVRLVQAENEDPLEHLNHIVVGVIVVVQQHDADREALSGLFERLPSRGPPRASASVLFSIRHFAAQWEMFAMHKPVYLDHHATTPVDPRVLDAMLPYFSAKFGNAASRSHRFGWEAEKAVDLARKQVASLAGATPREIVFTSGATESNNLAIKGAGADHIVTMATEHKAVLDPARWRTGLRLTILPPRPDGLIDLDALRHAIDAATTLVSVMYANNEIGVVQPVREIGEICREKDALFHCDAAQALGKIPLDVADDRIDLLSITRP